MPVGYVPELTRIAAAPAEDIDILFYGSMNERRNNVISQLRQAGLNAHTVFGTYGPARRSRPEVPSRRSRPDWRIFPLFPLGTSSLPAPEPPSSGLWHLRSGQRSWCRS